MTLKELAKAIDLSILKPDTKEAELCSKVEEATRYSFAGICVPPCYTADVAALLKDVPTATIAVVGFPLGYHTTKTKLKEAELALNDGAEELDMVINISALKSRRLDTVKEEITLIKKLAGNRVVKVIIECCYLTEEEKLICTRLIEECGADFVKTSTGFGPQGATIADVRLLRKLSPSLKLKAAGGIRLLAEALDFIEAGAHRIGTSNAIDIIEEFKRLYGDKVL